MFGHKVLLAFVAILSLLVAAPHIMAQSSSTAPGSVRFNIELKRVTWLTVPDIQNYSVVAKVIRTPDAEPVIVYNISFYFIEEITGTSFEHYNEWQGYEASYGYIITVYARTATVNSGTTITYIPPAWRSFYTSITTSDLQNLLLGSYLDFFLLGAIGKAFRVSETQIDFYEIIEGTTQGVLALRITQEEVDEALEEAGEATCVKASKNDRASVTVWADGNVTFSIGPDYETKIFHVLLEGGLDGSIIGHSTTYGPPAGAHCAN